MAATPIEVQLEERSSTPSRTRLPESIEELERAIEEASHCLAAQAPLEVFVHHNTLHAFGALPFHDAIEEARKAYGAEGYLREDQYRAAYRAGRITDADVDAALTPVPLGAFPATLPEPHALARLMLVHDIGPETTAGLAWQLAEHSAATKFADGVSPIAAERIRNETGAWLRREAQRSSSEGLLELVVGQQPSTERADVAAMERFGTRRPLKHLETGVVKDAIAVACLWEACRVLSARAVASPLAPSGTPEFPREAVLRITADDPNDLAHPLLINFAGAFLDRGLTRWSMPHADQGFFRAFCKIIGAGHALRPTWLAGVGRRLRAWDTRNATSEEVILELLAELGIASSDQPAFIKRTLLELPGWGGMFHRLESSPGPTGRARAKVRLVDFLAVRLCLDTLALTEVGRRLGHRGRLDRLAETCAKRTPLAAAATRGDHDRAWPLFLMAQHAGLAAPELLRAGATDVEKLVALLERFDRRAHLRVWHEAYERNYRVELLRALHVRALEAHPETPARFQAVYCLDERFESMRRHFEEVSAAHQTFGLPGFFNLAIAYQGLDDPSTFPLCPVVLTPQHRIEEEAVSEHGHLAHARRRRLQSITNASATIDRASRSLVWGTIITAVAGLVAALPLLASVFFPWVAGRLRQKVSEWLVPAPRTRLTAARAEGDDRDGLVSGFTLSEKADRVGAALENIGLVKDFARIVVLIGHDSSSVNNPHFAAYSCGACGGRSGGPNARLFAHMANRDEVREMLRSRGIDIPDTTRFVGAKHDTCADAVHLFDVEDIPAHFIPDLMDLQAALDEACRRNAHERCRRFESAPRGATPAEALRHVEGRSFDLSQPRPELGHATNAACVVGRRRLTRGLFLDRRAFLVSYDPTIDKDGRILERILTAVSPVCAGINLEYFFSTTDNERYGAGTKGPHNVTGLFGVMNGPSSDLRTGLPRQMIEIHEPMRLSMVVECDDATFSAILERQPELRELVANEWVKVALLHPNDDALSILGADGRFEPWRTSEARLPRVGRSSDWYQGRTGFLAPVLIERDDPASEVPHAG